MISEVMGVYGDLVEVPLHCYRVAGADTNRWGSSAYVTPRQVREASDRFDAEGALEDIDTQWGLIPEGGALDYCGYGLD